jgi:thiazole synthase ThiGH ThiG subunit
MDATFIVAREKLRSRPVLGAGGAPSMRMAEEMLDAAQTAMCTVSMRRADRHTGSPAERRGRTPRRGVVAHDRHAGPVTWRSS